MRMCSPSEMFATACSSENFDSSRTRRRSSSCQEGKIILRVSRSPAYFFRSSSFEEDMAEKRGEGERVVEGGEQLYGVREKGES